MKRLSPETYEAGPVAVRIAPTSTTMRKLKRRGRLDVHVSLSFVSLNDDETATTETDVTLEKRKKRSHA